MAECHLCHPQLSPCRLLPSNWRIVDTRHSSVLRVCYMSLDWVNIYIYLKSIVQTIRDNCCPPTVNRTRRPILIMNQCNCFHFKSHQQGIFFNLNAIICIKIYNLTYEILFLLRFYICVVFIFCFVFGVFFVCVFFC